MVFIHIILVIINLLKTKFREQLKHLKYMVVISIILMITLSTAIKFMVLKTQAPMVQLMDSTYMEQIEVYLAIIRS